MYGAAAGIPRLVVSHKLPTRWPISPSEYRDDAIGRAIESSRGRSPADADNTRPYVTNKVGTHEINPGYFTCSTRDVELGVRIRSGRVAIAVA